MPQTYSARDLLGREIEFEWKGEGEPTEADIEEVFRSAKILPPQPPEPFDPSRIQKAPPITEEESARLAPIAETIPGGFTRVREARPGQEGLPVDPLSMFSVGMGGITIPSVGAFAKLRAGLSAKNVEKAFPASSSLLKLAPQAVGETKSILPQAARTIEQVVKEAEGVVASRVAEEEVRLSKAATKEVTTLPRTAIETKSGKILTGDRGEIHSLMYKRLGIQDYEDIKSVGWIDKNGRYFSNKSEQAKNLTGTELPDTLDLIKKFEPTPSEISTVDKLISEGKALSSEREKLLKQIVEPPKLTESEKFGAKVLPPKPSPPSSKELSKSDFDLLRSEEGLLDLGALKQPVDRFRLQLRSALDFIQDPRYVLNKDPTGLGATLWRRLAEADRAGAKFMDDFTKQAQAGIKVAPNTESSAKIGRLLDKPEESITSYEWASLSRPERETFDFLRKKFDEFGEVLVKKGILEDKRRIKGYLFRVFDKDTIYQAAKNERAFVLDAIEDQGLSSVQSATKKKRLEQLNNIINTYEKTGTILHDYIPKELSIPFLKQRAGAAGYSTDAVRAMEIYAYYARRKFFDEPAIKEVLPLLEQMPLEHRPYARWFMRNYLKMEKPPSFNQLTRLATSFEYFKDLAFNPRSALMNATQNLNTLVELDGPLGPIKALSPFNKSWTREGAYRAMFDPEANAIWLASGHQADPASLRYGFTNKIKTPIEKSAMYLFDKVEMANRKIAYLGAYYKALNEAKSSQMAKVFADEVTYKTQFPYGRIGAPRLMEAVPGGPALMQFSTFSIKELQLFTQWVKENPSKLISYLIVSGGIGEGLKSLDIDMSNALGIGGDPVELGKALFSLAKGEATAAKIHAEMGLPRIPLTSIGSAGGGIFPSGVFPVGNTIKDAITKDTIKALSPVPFYRLYESVRAVIEGQQTGVMGGELGYPLRDRKSGYIREFESLPELAMRNLLARPYKETKGFAETKVEGLVEEARTQKKQAALWAYGKGDTPEFERLQKKYGLVFSEQDFTNLFLRRGASPEMVRRVKELQHKQDWLFKRSINMP